MTKVPILGKSIGSTFTEVMTFEEPTQDRLPLTTRSSTQETTEVNGEYHLEEAGSGTHVSIELGLHDCRPAVPQGDASSGRGSDRDRDGGEGSPVRTGTCCVTWARK